MTLFVTDHSITRYLERTGQKHLAEQKIKDIVENGRPARPKNPAVKMMNHRYEETEYYHNGGFIAVVIAGVVVTVMRPAKGEWILENHRRIER